MMNTPSFYIHAFFLLCLLTTTPLSALAEKTKKPSATDPVQVKVVTVREELLSSRVEIVGTVQAVDRAAIAAKIAGTIIELPVTLGSRVNKGDLLVKINAQEISARLLQAQAQLAQAKRNLQREKKLLQQHASTPETVKTMRDMLAIAEAGYREAASMLNYTTINAPFSGVITKKIANIGDLATPGMVLLRLEDDSRLQIITAIPESSVPDIKIHKQLQVTVPTTAKTITGEVAEISPVIDPHSRTMPIKINLGDTQGLRSGMFARITLPGHPYKSLMVPKQAVVPFGQLNKIFVIKDGVARLRLVRTGIQDNNKRIEILSGLQAGERVIITNNRLLVSGRRVKATD